MILQGFSTSTRRLQPEPARKTQEMLPAAPASAQQASVSAQQALSKHSASLCKAQRLSERLVSLSECLSAWRGLVSACCERLAERLLRYALPEDAHWSSTKPVQVNTAVCVVRNEVWAYA